MPTNSNKLQFVIDWGKLLFAFSLLAILLIPIAISVLFSRNASISEFLYNDGQTSFLSTTASIVTSNIGIGSFVIIFLFANQSPVIGFSIVAVDTIGLLICAALAKRVHTIARETKTFSLIDLIAVRHGAKKTILIWWPIAVIFALRTSIQLLALATIIQSAFALSATYSALIAAAVIASYVLIGGYKAATQTDLFQGFILLVSICILWPGIWDVKPSIEPFFSLGPYTPVLLVGIWLFLPFSIILSVDHWHRITTAKSAGTASKSYYLAALLSGGVAFTIAWAGYIAPSGADVFETFRSLSPAQIPWLAEIMIAACIMSSIDTFVMPLMATWARLKFEKQSLRVIILLFFAVVTIASILFGNIFENLIAAFNTLTIILPVTIGAIYGKSQPAAAAYLSLNIGFILTLILTTIDMNSAAVGGFLASTVIYLMVVKLGNGRNRSQMKVSNE